MFIDATNVENCPFCGKPTGVGLYVEPCYKKIRGKVFYNKYYILCIHCEARGPAAFGEEEAIEKWNRRYTSND